METKKWTEELQEIVRKEGITVYNPKKNTLESILGIADNRFIGDVYRTLFRISEHANPANYELHFLKCLTNWIPLLNVTRITVMTPVKKQLLYELIEKKIADASYVLQQMSTFFNLTYLYRTNSRIKLITEGEDLSTKCFLDELTFTTLKQTMEQLFLESLAVVLFESDIKKKEAQYERTFISLFDIHLRYSTVSFLGNRLQYTQIRKQKLSKEGQAAIQLLLSDEQHKERVNQIAYVVLTAKLKEYDTDKSTLTDYLPYIKTEQLDALYIQCIEKYESKFNLANKKTVQAHRISHLTELLKKLQLIKALFVKHGLKDDIFKF